MEQQVVKKVTPKLLTFAQVCQSLGVTSDELDALLDCQAITVSLESNGVSMFKRTDVDKYKRRQHDN